MLSLDTQLLMNAGITLGVSLVLALCFTPVAMYMARILNVMDKPSARKVHVEPKPYLGGVAIYIAFIVGTLLYTELTQEVIAILIGATIMMLVGALDDKFDLPAKPRLALQFGCAFLAVWSGVRVEVIANPFTNEYISLGIFSWPLTILWIITTTNTMNFIDGLDGLTAGTTVIVSASLALVAWRQDAVGVMFMVMALAGSCLGFLRYNFNPAKIFMGDAGAIFIGYCLGCLTVLGPMKHAAFWTMIAPVIALGLPIFDTAIVMFRRIKRGQSPMQADRTHAHHRLFDNGMSQRQTVFWLYAISICFGVAAIGITSQVGRLAAMAVGILGFFLFLYAHRLDSKKVDQRRTMDITETMSKHLSTTRDYSQELGGLINSPRDRKEREEK